MDEKPYKSVSDLYAFLDKHADTLTEKEISYMLGVLKTLNDLYSSEADLASNKNIDIDHLKGTWQRESTTPTAWQRIWRGLFGK